jgi:hypothetical protein
MPPQLYDRGDIVLLPNEHRGIVSHCNASSVVVHDLDTSKDYFVYKHGDVTRTGEATQVVDDNDEFVVASMLFDYVLSHGTSEDIDDCLNWNRDNVGKTKNPMLGTIVRDAIDEMLMESGLLPREMRNKMKQYRFFYKLFVKEPSIHLNSKYYTAPVVREGSAKRQKTDA